MSQAYSDYQEYDFNTGSASDTPRRSITYWPTLQKQCGGMTECGMPCHKGMNCTIVDSYQKDDKTVYKYYCRVCKEFGEGSPSDGCKD
ncbi:MAG TPA: hypothetical protein ENI23_01595 [bacterium]|nr:hypothetical protein [bacterium]